MIERINFGSPLLKNLKENGFLCIDMHFHSKYSDTFTKPKNIIKYAAKKEVGLAITDHNHIKGFIEAYKYNKGLNYNVPLLPGIELSTKQGPHLLLYFYNASDAIDFYEKHIENAKARNPYMALRLTAEQIVERALGYNCVISAAHPMSVSIWDFQNKINKGEIDKKIIRSIECVEVICGLILRRMNIKAVKW
ncbi:MAG: PHP domain-containing protein, partial [Candidatus Woesearchaeota archaeon]|nr:PHP domain-containing protein [Candidatus Woesearchaeota archaeon]